MKNGVPRFVCSSLCSVVLLASACSQPPTAATPRAQAVVSSTPATSAPASAPPTAPLPALRTGAFEPIEHKQVIPGQVTAAEQTGDVQTFLVTVPRAVLPVVSPKAVEVAIRGEGQLLSVAGVTSSTEVVEIWLRKQARKPVTAPSAVIVHDAASSESLATLVDVYTAARVRDAVAGSQPGHHYQVSVELPQTLKPNPKLIERYLEAVIEAAPVGSPISWLLPTARLERRASGAEAEAAWMQLMRLSSGYESIESALATDPTLSAAVAPPAASVSLEALRAPALQRHPWAEMLKAVPSSDTTEPLAALLPADFYFVRARSFDAFQALLSHVDELVTPVLGVTSQRREVLDLSDSYRLELGLPEGELTRVLGPELIRSLALAGSDPLLRQGSDLSLLMEVPSVSAVVAAIALRRAELGREFPLNESTWAHAGVEVKVFSSARGEVRQHVATHTSASGQSYVLVSNSPNAVRRIIDVWLGKTSKLSDELDFQYMLRRDASVKDDVLAYMSDKFVAQVVSPRQRILEVRRQVAKSELANVGYSALLHAQVLGVLPPDGASLNKVKWLSAARSKHTTGESISYSPLQGPQSSWGSAARLTSIIDLPTPRRVSKTEQQAYQAFVENYERRWGENIDPIALRITTTATALDGHVRVLPVANINDYSEIARFSGGGSTSRVPSLPALAAVLAIGEQSELRSLLSRQGESFLGGQLKLDWLGDWLEVGLADDPLLAQTALEYGDFPRPPDDKAKSNESDFSVLGKLPFYLSVDIKSAAGAALLLTTLRKLATDAAPDVVRWQELKTSGEHKIVHVSFDDVSLYYSLGKNRFLLSPDLSTLHSLLTQPADDRSQSNSSSSSAQAGGQLVVEFNPRMKESALRVVAGWFAELGVHETGLYNPLADLLLRAVPATANDAIAYRHLARAHFGGVPVTPEGVLYQRASSGLLDPARGTAHAPQWPNLPVSGGAVEHILRILRRLRTEVSIDAEPGSPGVTSLRTRLLLER